VEGPKSGSRIPGTQGKVLTFVRISDGIDAMTNAFPKNMLAELLYPEAAQVTRFDVVRGGGPGMAGKFPAARPGRGLGEARSVASIAGG